MRTCLRFLACLLIAVALSACTTTRKVALTATSPPPLPQPLFDRLPIAVAVWYAPELASYRAIGTKTQTKPNGDQIVTHYDIECGDAHLAVLRQMISAAFREVKPLESAPNGALGDATVDLIVVPKVERVAYGGGADVRYSIALIRPNGEHLTNVFVTGSAPESLPEERWLDVAIRDAAAQVLVRLTRSEKLAEWLTQHRRAGAPRTGLGA